MSNFYAPIEARTGFNWIWQGLLAAPSLLTDIMRGGAVTRLNCLRVAFVLGMVWQSQAGAQVLDSAQCEADVTSQTQITNFHVVVPGRIFRGSRPTSIEDVGVLKQACGVGQVLNLQGGDPWFFNPIPLLLEFENGELSWVRNAENKEVQAIMSQAEENIPLDSFWKVSPDQERMIEEAVSVLQDANTNPNAKPLFLHCQHGIDRTGLIVALFKVFHLGVSPQVAQNEWMTYAHDHRAFLVGSLIEYCEERPEGTRCVNQAMKDYFDLATAAPMSLHKVRDQMAIRAARRGRH